MSGNDSDKLLQNFAPASTQSGPYWYNGVCRCKRNGDPLFYPIYSFVNDINKYLKTYY